jgi:hypothetical protein
MKTSKDYSMQRYMDESGMELYSFSPILLNGWYVKASLTNLDTICIIMQSATTNQFDIGFFHDEVDANRFINSHTIAK